ncbi:MAG TPA: pyridoxal-dependent decarboxylase, partial [Gemmatimonadales bacterium]
MSEPILNLALRLAAHYRDNVATYPVFPRVTADDLREALGGSLPETGRPAEQVLTDLVQAAEPGLVASSGPRYFGFVVGGSLPVTTATDWMVSAWDQNTGIYALSPAASVVEEVAAGWLKELFGLAASVSVGFVTGGGTANFTCLAAARHGVLRRAGWDVEAKGLSGAPRINLVVSDQ